MEQIEGRIEKIEKFDKDKMGVPLQSSRYEISIDGKKYSTFNASLFENFKAGDLVSVELEQKGKFKNPVSIKALTEPSQKVSQNGSITQNEVSEVIKGIIVTRTERANSYEFGKAGNRFKIYFEDKDELLRKIEELVEVGLVESPFITDVVAAE